MKLNQFFKLSNQSARTAIQARFFATNATNIKGKPLEKCSTDPLTGFFRDGYCNTDEFDHGSHTVCSEMTEDFLRVMKEKGNDLSTPMPEYGFPGLKPGDKWCVCADRWEQAREAGLAGNVDLDATHIKAGKIVKK